MIFDSLVTAIESARQVVIGARRGLTTEHAAEIQQGNRALLSLAGPELVVTNQDAQDRETALLCQHQLEELMARLLPQIQD